MKFFARLFSARSKAARTAPVRSVTCAKCGKVYHLGRSAVAYVPEIAFKLIQAASGGAPMIPDLLSQIPDLSEDDGSGTLELAKPHLEIISKSLAAGQHRRWTCHACNSVNSYS